MGRETVPHKAPRSSAKSQGGVEPRCSWCFGLLYKEGRPELDYRSEKLPICSPKRALPSLVMSTPCGGRWVRYGKLRFPSCTSFHPPGAPLPFGARYSPHSDSAWLLGKAPRLGSGRLVLTLVAWAVRTDSQRVPTRIALARSEFFGRHVSGGRALESYVLRLRRSRAPHLDAHLWEQL